MSPYRKIGKPEKSEYPEYSAIYMDLISDDSDVLQSLKDNFYKIKAFVYSLPEEKLFYKYARGKWTIKEILVHLIDDERIFSYRALRYGRNDDTPLHGFEQDDYAHYSGANERSLESIFAEYEAVRESTLQLLQNLPENAFMRRGSGIDSDGSIVNSRTVRAIAYHIAGHELRHIKIIKERYLDQSTEYGIV